ARISFWLANSAQTKEIPRINLANRPSARNAADRKGPIPEKNKVRQTLQPNLEYGLALQALSKIDIGKCHSLTVKC
ncbi:MAG: hypothetical protein WCD77_13670, partial [Acidobacteriaceae bacterium]